MYLCLGEKPSSCHIQPQGKSQTCLILNNEQQSASCIMPLTSADEPVWQCYLMVCLVCFIFFLPPDDIWLFFKLISYAFFPLHRDISFPITYIHSFYKSNERFLCPFPLEILYYNIKSIKVVPDKLNVTDIQNLKTAMCWEDLKKHRCIQGGLEAGLWNSWTEDLKSAGLEICRYHSCFLHFGFRMCLKFHSC